MNQTNEKEGCIHQIRRTGTLRQLQEELLYCNCVDYFANLEHGHAACDPHENVT